MSPRLHAASPERSPLLDVQPRKEGNDASAGGLENLGRYATLAELAKVAELKSILGWPILCGDLSRASRLQVSLRLPVALRARQLGQALSAADVRSITFDPKLVLDTDPGWTPPGAHWAATGDFFHETAEFFDPVQGAVANCHYIAALSAIAWATPFRIAHLARATGPNQSQFNDQINFFQPDSGGALDKAIQVTEAVPMAAGGDYIYCRSSEIGETWPAIYEKAFAKLKTGTATDIPDIPQTAWGDCLWATAQLNGGTRHGYNTAEHSTDELWQRLRSNCLSYRTFNPMAAWTYSTGDAAPDTSTTPAPTWRVRTATPCWAGCIASAGAGSCCATPGAAPKRPPACWMPPSRCTT